MYTVSDAYFDVLEAPVVAGREFRENATQQVAILDQLLATQLFGSENPVGRRVALPNSSVLEGPAEIVGVVATVRDSIFQQERVAHLYLPTSRHTIYNTQLHSATTAVPTSELIGALRGATREVDLALPILDLRSFRNFLNGNIEIWTLRTGARLFGTFALVALLLSMAGIYGVQAYRVAQRTKEIGLRMALGSTLRNTVSLIMRDALRVATIGATLGVLLAAAVATVMRAVLVEVSATDPVVLGAAWFGLLAVAFLACLVPARRAAQLDPLRALREE